MTTESQDHQPTFMAPSQINEVLATGTHTICRFENRPFYLSDVTSGAMNDWLAGRPIDLRMVEPWCEFVRGRIEARTKIQRVRVHEDPRTLYQEWLIRVSKPVVEAGEDQRYLTRKDAMDLGVTTGSGDWWLIDQSKLLVFHNDSAWNTLIEVTSDPVRVTHALKTWSATFPNAQPLN